ncbi:sialate O-acetylesterase [Siphonobacter sp. SORGH_AS_0500]|uniref:sialate O-acetylesterase n=1 Tax=Siphonobacter sp. SORGH_AS_0500 TaxID=1864824 RepID=UPI00285CCF7C|nr:sialate O-acetylesterase [Siphonobacter sp. SORGH_AS_0500]MDR6193405.1 hypothetical protein [Siphonobacter sp. SORGH_AS_0500]
MYHRYCLILYSLVLFPLLSHSQITLTSPTSRSVYQRNNQNQATITVAGNYSEPVDEIKVRFQTASGTNIGPNAAEDEGWKSLWQFPGTTTATPSNGYFQGNVTVKGGWYDLKVQAYRNGSQLGSEVTLSKVGVGEVFIITGQSNATGNGDANNTGPSASYDQVSAVAIGYRPNPEPNPGDPSTWSGWGYSSVKDRVAIPSFVHLDATTPISPFGLSSWYWGAFGDKLVDQLRVPVAFFQAGWSGSATANWFESLNENATSTSAFGYNYPAGQPYANLRITLNNYAAQFGVRAVLMHLGETDNYLNTPSDVFANRWSQIIAQSRQQSNKPNLAWVVARASRFAISGPSTVNPNIIAGQNSLIANNTNVYAGPATDGIHNDSTHTYRDANDIHFSGAGHYAAAQAWLDALNPIFSSLTPYEALPSTRLYPSCTNGQMVVKGDANWTSYTWVNTADNYGVNTTASGSQATLSQGSYQLKVRDAYDNVLLSPRINVPNSLGSVSAAITANSPLSAGNNLQLQASGGLYYSWAGPNNYTSSVANPVLTGVTGATSGTYTLTVANLYGCKATATQQVTVITDYISAKSGDWTDYTTWTANCPGCIPTRKTNVTIKPQHQIQFNAGAGTASQN